MQVSQRVQASSLEELNLADNDIEQRSLLIAKEMKTELKELLRQRWQIFVWWTLKDSSQRTRICSMATEMVFGDSEVMVDMVFSKPIQHNPHHRHVHIKDDSLSLSLSLSLTHTHTHTHTHRVYTICIYLCIAYGFQSYSEPFQVGV
mgnify:FL=1